jgi:seryl-tRNA synthetase
MSVGLQRLRDEPDAIRRGAIAKGEDPALIDRALEVDAERRRLLAEVEALKAERNMASKEIGKSVSAYADIATGTGAAFDAEVRISQLKSQSAQAGALIKASAGTLAETEAELDDLLLRIPNPPDLDIPVGGEEANVTVRSWGDPLPVEGTRDDGSAWARRPHWELGDALGILDNTRGAKIAGSGFPVYKGAGSALQRGLINWFLDVHTRENGMTEIWPPAVVNTASATGTGQIPDKEDQMYVVTRDELYLVPTAEVPVTNLHRDEILDADQLPIRYAAYSPCFRREAGAAGKDTRGILRVHQFDKVEMVLFERPEDSRAALEWMTERAEILLQRLGLAYRVLLMATRDMGFTQARKYDLEVWAPGVERWLEVSSCSNFGDFQARRMAIRYRPEPGAKPELVHTLNGSGLALARVVAALLETYQQADGSVTVPEVLRPYVGRDSITA